MEKDVDAPHGCAQLIGPVELGLDQFHRAESFERRRLGGIGERTYAGAHLMPAVEQGLDEVETQMSVAAGDKRAHGNPSMSR